MDTTFLYVLTDPVTGAVRYLGKSYNPFKRMKGHMRDSAPSHKKNWIDSLKAQGLIPHMDLLDEVPVSQWEFWEREYIRVFRAIGIPLTNQCEGGENPPNMTGTKRPPMSDEWKAKISRARTGRFAGKNSSRFGVKNSPEHRERISQAKKGRPVHPAVLSAALKANLGRKHSTETIARRSLSLRGRPVSLETREKIGRANSNPSDETRAKMSAKAKGFCKGPYGYGNIKRLPYFSDGGGI